MSKGYLKHQERRDEVRSFGRILARRSKSRCELCEAANVRLDPVEVAPEPEEPDPDHCVFLCESCRSVVEGGRVGEDTQWRFLESTVWTECAPAQVVAVRLLRRLAEAEIGWARDTLDNLYLDTEVEEWVNAG